MGVKITVGGYPYQAVDYSTTEEATPLSAGDTMGSVGSITFTIPVPDVVADPNNPYVKFGPDWFLDRPVTLSDSHRGYTLGKVKAIGESYDGAMITVECESRLAELNVYNVNAQPFVGTLGGAVEYYLSLAGITDDWYVDDSVASRNVVLPGFTGELWLHLKRLAAAQDCDVSLVSGVVLFRPIRIRVAETGKTTTRSRRVGGGNLAQSVEVYWYESRAITDELVYPPKGWDPNVPVFNVNAGETSEAVLELSASVSSIQTPVMQTFVDQDYDASSVYTIVADDGLPVDPTLWASKGGSVDITINPDTKSLTLKMTGAVDIPTAAGTASKAFSIALASDTTGSRYSTLRIVGTGVSYDRKSRLFRTAVPPSRTATEIGVTIDNPMITDFEALMRTGVRAAKEWAGVTPSLAGVVTTINKRGDSGQAQYPTYGDVQDALESELGSGFTYDDAETWYQSESLNTYYLVREHWFDTVRNDYENQVFGNVNGARVWDEKTKRWYRIRSGTVSRGTISFEGADDDLTYGDIESVFTGTTYGDIQTLRTNLTYQDDYLLGARIA